MRITSSMMMETAVRNIQANEQRQSNLQAEISSGLRINKPSDDPIGTAQAIDLQQTLDASKQYATNMDHATSWLNLADSTLGSVSDTLNRANELAVQAANGTLNTSDMGAISAEVNQLQQQVLGLSEAKFGSYYIFSGTKSNQPGYTAPSSASYQGNSQPVKLELAPGVNLPVNADAQSTFNPVFDALNQLQTGLTTNNTATIQASLTALSSAADAVNLSRSEIGATTNRVQFLQTQQQTQYTTLTSQLSQVKDADMVQTISDFSMAQTTYQASLKAAAQSLQSSLLDYLK
jgi:flagellar hook-associated protein 3 FlgL